RDVPDLSESIAMIWASVSSQGGVFQIALLLTFINLIVLNVYVAKHSRHVEKEGLTGFFVAYDLVFPKGIKGLISLALFILFIGMVGITIYLGAIG
uniref:hypothetical protein n=1 Tax=Alcanivorax sp. TaxID=1872427 RepID=UPI002635B9A8